MSAATRQAPTAEARPKSVAGPAVGERVHVLREAMGWSLRELAERSGVSAPMLSQVERGETSPTLAVAAKIAAGLELTLSQLLRTLNLVRVYLRLLMYMMRSHPTGLIVLPGKR